MTFKQSSPLTHAFPNVAMVSQINKISNWSRVFAVKSVSPDNLTHFIQSLFLGCWNIHKCAAAA